MKTSLHSFRQPVRQKRAGQPCRTHRPRRPAEPVQLIYAHFDPPVTFSATECFGHFRGAKNGPAGQVPAGPEIQGALFK